ncbi:MAG: DNA polymerase III subunit delta [Ruminococcaceae bacterium]|nr:DNA polymerase III subunit delta [Oscillospiraceae bacterium]
MKIDELKQILKGQKPAPRVFVLWGEEAHLKNYYKKQLIDLLSPDVMEDLNIFRFDGKNYSVSLVDEAIEALPVMSDKKLLLFTDSYIFKPDGRTGAKAEYRDYWTKRLTDIPDYVSIIFDESSVDKRSGLLKQVDKEGACLEFAFMGEEEMVGWTQKLFATMGKTISLQDARYINEITPAGMMAVRREAEKLSAYVGEREEITRTDIERLVIPTIEGKVFDMVGAMLCKNTDAALRLLDDLFKSNTEVHAILPPLIYNADKLMQTKLLMGAGADKSQIMSKLKISPFQASKYMRDCAKYSQSQLKHLVQRLAETDGYLKSHSMSKDVLVSLLVSEFS